LPQAALRPATTSWPEPPATPFRRRVWEMLTRGQELIKELMNQHRQVHAEALRGTPFPVLTPKK